MRHVGYSLRLSVASGVRPALQLFLVVVAMLPIRLLIDHLFGERSTIDWRASVFVGGSLAILLYVGVVLSTFADVQRAMVRGRQVFSNFPAATSVSGLYGLVAILAVVLSVGMHGEADVWWLETIPLVFLLLAFYGWPRTIHSDDRGIWQRSRFGRKVFIPYPDVLAITKISGGILVASPDSSIELTQFHAGADQFVSLLSKRTGKEIT